MTVTTRASTVREVPDALRDGEQFAAKLAGRRPAVFLEPKRASVAVHYRLANPEHHTKLTAVVDELLDEYSGRLKVTPGKMVYALQPKIGHEPAWTELWDVGDIQLLRERLLLPSAPHGSTLSLVTHAAVLARLDPESSWKRFLVALERSPNETPANGPPARLHRSATTNAVPTYR